DSTTRRDDFKTIISARAGGTNLTPCGSASRSYELLWINRRILFPMVFHHSATHFFSGLILVTRKVMIPVPSFRWCLKGLTTSDGQLDCQTQEGKLLIHY